MLLEVKPTPLYRQKQRVDLRNEKVLTLVGENGCGKSAILEKVFESRLHQEEGNFISFSSGQNERYSDIFDTHLKKSKRFLIENYRTDQNSLNAFNFDKKWARLLIFFATALKPQGNVRKFFTDRGYVDVSTDGLNNDLTSKLNFSIRVPKDYVLRHTNDLNIEALNPEHLSFRQTIVHQLLEKLILSFISDYDFEIALKKSQFSLNASDVFTIFDNDVNAIFTFLGYACYKEKFLDINTTKLYLKNSLELKQLSDGEFQLLNIFAIIDLFDTDNTFFLFDEIDSHLHYLNTKRLWKVLSKIRGKVLTTTHSADSIIQNELHQIRLVNKGKIETKTLANDILSRLDTLSANQNLKLSVASKIKYIALIEDQFDWEVFKLLASKKVLDYDPSVLDKIQIVKCSAGYEDHTHTFGNSKIDWVDKFIEFNGKKDFVTKRIFMICDRDNLPVEGILQDLKVKGRGRIELNKGKKGTKVAFLLSWKRREIENYLLSYTMLQANGKLEELNSLLPVDHQIKENNSCDNASVQRLDVKKVLQPLYIMDGVETITVDERGVDFDKVKSVIDQIPASEISDDISSMYNLIKKETSN